MIKSNGVIENFYLDTVDTSPRPKSNVLMPKKLWCPRRARCRPVAGETFRRLGSVGHGKPATTLRLSRGLFALIDLVGSQVDAAYNFSAEGHFGEFARFNMVNPPRLERGTSSSSCLRSNQLSYGFTGPKPHSNQTELPAHKESVA